MKHKVDWQVICKKDRLASCILHKIDSQLYVT